ncbi:MAG: thiolase family protein [Burkholderiales bacterium]|nr:thiolase family protein [Burkholderiales bacterium]
MAYITGVGDTAFGRHAGETALTLMAQAANAALADAGLARAEVDGLLCGYATTLPHLMLSTVFAEYYGLQPVYAHALQLGGATGCAMAMLARELVDAGRCREVLVVAGENRLSGQTRDAAIQTLAQVGHPDYEVPYGASVPAYYALLASRYMHEYPVSETDLAEFAVLMRRHAGAHPGAHLKEPISVADVLASKKIAAPLKLLDCCPISDGAVALLVSREPRAGLGVRIAGAGQAHLHQHVSSIASVSDLGARRAARSAMDEAGVGLGDIDYLGIYDSFSITLLILLEEIGIAARGAAAARLGSGDFAPAGRLPLNTHGGLLSYGHCGVAGGMAHIAEAQRQLARKAGARQAGERHCALVHGDGGVLSSHVSLVLRRDE